MKLDINLIDPNLINWLDLCKCSIGFAEVFVKEPGVEFAHALHLDGVVFDNHVKLNFVVDPGTSVMRWWQLSPGNQCFEKTTIVGTRYLWARRAECTLLAESSLAQPSLINAGQLHSVDQIDKTRICYSFMLVHKDTKKRVLWSDIGSMFGEYVQ